MTGYRDPVYDPNAWEPQGRPLRPFNWVQWLGVALTTIGVLAYVYSAGASFGWVPKIRFQPMMAGLPLLLIGIALVNSRRQGETDLAPELAAARKRTMLITIAIVAVILGAAAAIDFTGAN